jgi:hypothetical protein
LKTFFRHFVEEKKTETATTHFRHSETKAVVRNHSCPMFYLRMAALRQGCQMMYFQTKNPKLGIFFGGPLTENVGISSLWPLGILNGNLVYVLAIWYTYFVAIRYILLAFCLGILLAMVYFLVILYILWTFGIFCGPLIYFSCFGTLHQGKSGSPALRGKFLTHFS